MKLPPASALASLSLGHLKQLLLRTNLLLASFALRLVIASIISLPHECCIVPGSFFESDEVLGAVEEVLELWWILLNVSSSSLSSKGAGAGGIGEDLISAAKVDDGAADQARASSLNLRAIVQVLVRDDGIVINLLQLLALVPSEPSGLSSFLLRSRSDGLTRKQYSSK